MRRNRFEIAKGWIVAGITLAILTLVAGHLAFAQPSMKEVLQQSSKGKEASTQAATVDPNVPLDDLGRGTPRSAIEGFVRTTREGQYETAVGYMDTRRMSEKQKAEAALWARGLRIVLDRKLWIDLDLLSDDPKGHLQDGLPAYRDRVGRIDMPDGSQVDILLQRIPREDGVMIWKFSSATIARVGDLWEAHGYGPLPKFLPLFFFDVEFLGIRLWQWLGLIMAIPVIFATVYLTSWAVRFVVELVVGERAAAARPFLAGPLRVATAALILPPTSELLDFGLAAHALVRALVNSLLVIAVAWVFFHAVDLGKQMMITRLYRSGRPGAAPLLHPLSRVARVVVITLAVIAMLSSFGFNVTALLAGLGVGGLAVALAAQKTLENLIGGITLYGDQPVRVGDFCRFGGNVGTIEAIGLRSTRIRTLDRTVVSVPNAEFVNLHLDNFTKRDKIWYHPTIALRYETTPDQLRFILVEIRKLLYAHPKVDPDPARVRFVRFAAYSLEIEIFAYVTVTDYSEFLEVAEDLNLRIMGVIEQAGSGFAFPSQTTYVESGSPLDRGRARAAESQVADWRENNELYLPRFPKTTVDQLGGTLDYPPQGSPDAVGSGTTL